jgi:DNA-directed RNA polymerase specialized sigma24 family protein
VRGKNKTTQEGLDRLLSLLDMDREKAGERLERIREKLHTFFSRNPRVRSRVDVELLTDITIDRVIEKICKGNDIRNVGAYSRRVARYILLEYIKEPEIISIDGESGGYIASNRQRIDEGLTEAELRQVYLVCAGQCLQTLEPDDQELFLRAKRIRGSEKTTQEELATELGMTAAALRNKVFRIREKLEKCARVCIRKKSGINPIFLSLDYRPD